MLIPIRLRLREIAASRRRIISSLSGLFDFQPIIMPPVLAQVACPVHVVASASARRPYPRGRTRFGIPTTWITP